MQSPATQKPCMTNRVVATASRNPSRACSHCVTVADRRGRVFWKCFVSRAASKGVMRFYYA